MPIIIKDFTWQQTKSIITIQLPLRGVHQSKVNVFTGVRYLKISYEKFHFEAFLLHNINLSTSKCTISEAQIILELTKVEPEEWESLEESLTKPQKSEKREAYIEDGFDLYRKQCEDKVAAKHELKRLAVREAIKSDTKTREKIDDIRNTERRSALGDLSEWEANFSDSLKITEIEDDEKEELAIKPKPIHFGTKRLHIKPVKDYSKSKMKASVDLPPVRHAQTLYVEFTERILPTPSRESKADEENEWLRKQAEARRSAGFVSEDLRPEEKNPQFLLAKGDEFLRNRNFLGAISAYSFGIKISPGLVDFYIQRSEAQMEVGNFRKVIEDCSTAIEMMKPEVQANLDQRAVCVARRALALNKVGLKHQAAEEMSHAVKLKPMCQEYRDHWKVLDRDDMETVSSDSD